MSTPAQPQPGTPAPPTKKPYEAPAILSREPLEVFASVCTTPLSKTDPGACPDGPSSS